MHHFLDHDSFSVHVSAADTLLDDVGAKFLLGEFGNMTLEAEAERGGKGHIVQVQNVLNDVVAKGVLDKLEAMRSDLAHKLDFLKARGMIDAALKNTASVAVRTHSDTILTDSIEDELSILSFEMIETLLNHMVAVEVLNKSDNVATQSVDDDLNL